jgi:hypothetical protein
VAFFDDLFPYQNSNIELDAGFFAPNIEVEANPSISTPSNAVEFVTNLEAWVPNNNSVVSTFNISNVGPSYEETIDTFNNPITRFPWSDDQNLSDQVI